jgi:hypothetical protein
METKLLMRIHIDAFEIKNKNNYDTLYEVTDNDMMNLKNFLSESGIPVGIDNGESLRHELRNFKCKLKPIPGYDLLQEQVFYIEVTIENIYDFLEVLGKYKTDKNLAYVISKLATGQIDLDKIAPGTMIDYEEGYTLVIFNTTSHLEEVKTITL